MAENTKLQYIVELLTQGDTKKATDELTKLNKAGKDTATAMEKTLASSKQLFAFLGGTALIKESLDKFVEAERGINALNAALIQTGNDAPGALDAIKELADALGDDLKVQADDVIKVMTQLLSFGANPRDLKRLTELTYDLSEVMGRDVTRASRQMAQALKGDFTLFAQFGIEVDKSKTATENLNSAFNQLTANFGGRAKAGLVGAAGDVQGLSVTIDDAKQKLGEWSAAILTAVARVSSHIGETLGRADMVAAIDNQKAAYNALADAIAKAILEAEKLGKITKGEAGTLFGTLGGARSILRGPQTSFDSFTSNEDLRGIHETQLPQAGGLLNKLQKQLNLPGVSKSTAPASSGPGQINTTGLDVADLNKFYDDLDKMDAAAADNANKETERQNKLAEIQDRQSIEAMDNYQNAERMKQDLVDQTVLVMLDGEARVIAEMEINHDKRVQGIQDAKFETEEGYLAAMNAEALLYAEEQRRYTQSKTFAFKLAQDMKNVAQAGAQAFSSGLAGAIVSAFTEGGKAFQKFAATFMAQIAQMILQVLIMRAIMGIAGSFAGGAASAGAGAGVATTANIPMLAAAGGQWTAMADGGMMSASSPTFLPKFGVLAGEAGREMLTVLARPSFERINGVPAQIGYAGGNRLAITSADALAGAGGGAGGGVLEIRVTLSPDVKVEVMNNAVARSRVVMVQDMSNDSQLSRVTRQKMG